ncbi:MAG: hypothetical protein HOI45_17150 [Rhodospirillaceae bacterium]|nr:hypothetical protein [Rhodospirillaceae bacterium]
MPETTEADQIKLTGPVSDTNVMASDISTTAANDDHFRLEPIQQILDGMPTNVIMCDPVDFRIIYANETSLKL